MSKFEVRTTLRTFDIDGFYVVGRSGKYSIITKNINDEFLKFCWLKGVSRLSLELWSNGYSKQCFTKFDADFNYSVRVFFDSPYMEPEIKPHRDKLLFYLKNYKGSR